MVTPAPRHDTFAAFALGMRARRVPLLRSTEVVGILGRSRVEAVQLADGSTIECDTVVFTGDWVTDDELARRRGIELGSDPTTNRPDVFAVGNIRLVSRRADQCVRDALAAVESVTGAPPGVTASGGRDRWTGPHRRTGPIAGPRGPTLPAVTPHREAL